MEKKIYPVCKRCGRKLKTDEARERGYGPVCLLKMQANARHPLFERKENDTRAFIENVELRKDWNLPIADEELEIYENLIGGNNRCRE